MLLEAALSSGETDTSQLICSANLISRSLRKEKSSLELGGDGLGTFQSLLPLKYQGGQRTKQKGVETRRHTPGRVFVPQRTGSGSVVGQSLDVCCGAYRRASHKEPSNLPMS